MRKMRLGVALAVLGIAVLFADAAGAVEQTSTWLSANGTQQLRCRAVNVGKKPVVVLVELVGENGQDLATLTFAGCDGTALAPNQVCSAVADGPVSAYCRITSKSKLIRGALGIEAGNDTILIVPVTK
jgi:hypothetical protein